MQKTKKIIIPFFIHLVIFSAMVFPFTSHAVLVPCGVKDPTVLNQHPSYADPCDFKDLMDLINIVIRFIFVDLSVPIAAIMFFYAGFRMVTSGGSSEAKSKAKGVFTSTLIGLVCVAVSWLIIRTILSILGYDGSWIGF